jgi:hypothetical protein
VAGVTVASIYVMASVGVRDEPSVLIAGGVFAILWRTKLPTAAVMLGAAGLGAVFLQP